MYLDTTKNSICDECGKNAPIFGTSKPRLCVDCLPSFKNLLPGENPFIKKIKKKKNRKLEFKDKNYKHLCPDWDYLAIDKDSPEFECCLCFSKKSL